jgi:hypothetical protein
MGKKQNRAVSSISWGLLSILWGVTILFDFIPFGFGILGTGLLLLGVNALRSLGGLPARGDNTVLGILALVWGGLELARPLLRLLSESTDWDWGIFAILLMVLGGIRIARALPRMRRTGAGEPDS